MLKSIIFVAAAGVSAATPAAAPDAEFARFVEATEAATPPPAAAEIDAGAIEILQEMARKNGGCVPTGVAMEPPQRAAATRLVAQMVRSGQIRNGWTAYGRPAGCAAPSRVRFIILRRSTGELLVRVVNIGESIASPSLMRDSSAIAAAAAFAAVHKAHPDCAAPEATKMDRSRVVGKSSDLGPDYHGARYAGSWQEAWTFTVCNHRAEVPINFIADGQGGANWNIHADRAKLLD
jgi:hypothetical protein